MDAIKEHLQTVDNVPLLVNLYTDSTPSTISQMITIFRDYGEIVLTIGNCFRSYNQNIFYTSNISVSVCMLPGSNTQIPSNVEHVINNLPVYSQNSLCQEDLLLIFRLIGLGSIPLLQLPCPLRAHKPKQLQSNVHKLSKESYTINMNKDFETMRLAAIIESIRKGRLLLLGITQVIAFLCVSIISLACWSVIVQVIPINIPPVLTIPLLLLFICIYLPIISISLLFCDTYEGIMKNTPRKNYLLQKRGDEQRFFQYLLIRISYIIICIFIQSWVTCSSIYKINDINGHQLSWYNRMGRIIYVDLINNNSHDNMNYEDLSKYWIVQDIISCQLLFQIIMQAASLIER